jgi:hypothetical protein
MNLSRFERLMRWYPTSWRARYGDELVALLEDTYGDKKLSFAHRLGIIWGGLFEHLHEFGHHHDSRAPRENVRAGSLVVLWGWTMLIVAGSAFAKVTEHWNLATPRPDRQLPTSAYNVIQIAACFGAVVVMLAAAIVIPAVVRFIYSGGWAEIRRPVQNAMTASATTILLTVAMMIWSHHLGAAQRNTGLGAHLVGSVWAFLVVTTIVLCAFAAISVARHIHLSPDVLRIMGAFALSLAVAIVAVVGGTLVWAISIAHHAPSLLIGANTNLFDVPGTLVEIMVALLMCTGFICAVAGARRVQRSIFILG